MDGVWWFSSMFKLFFVGRDQFESELTRKGRKEHGESLPMDMVSKKVGYDHFPWHYSQDPECLLSLCVGYREFYPLLDHRVFLSVFVVYVSSFIFTWYFFLDILHYHRSLMKVDLLVAFICPILVTSSIWDTSDSKPVHLPFCLNKQHRD